MKIVDKRRSKSQAREILSTIPKGKASDVITQGCLVLEGGAFRGLYTQGFIDALMVNGINMSCVIGVSAGALGGMNYVSGQIGRSARVNIGFRHDSRYVGIKAMLHSKSILDVGFLTENRHLFEPFNEGRFWRPDLRFVAVATSLESGRPAYFEKGICTDIMQSIRASATMPFISPAVMIDDKPYFDGGCSCNIPYQWAIDQGFEKILVIKTRDLSFRYEEKVNDRAYRVYRNNPEFAEILAHSTLTCNFQYNEVDRLHEEGRLLRLAPSQPVAIGRIESNLEKLGELYWLGYHDCESQLPQIKQYLG